MSATENSAFLSKEELELKAKLEKKFGGNRQQSSTDNTNRLYTKKRKTVQSNMEDNSDSKAALVRTSEKAKRDASSKEKSTINEPTPNTVQSTATPSMKKKVVKTTFLDELLSSRKKKK
ncbi:hypothetical protein BB561_000972 [Smittium simulii]|uniref:Uncharacterized protein n=1 Tax=Smittium simulii TaxID=133385 RepID=A0A2T9YWT9_9FUNG|nr:hypothetical protein BB561_000972 [Smittium simulii]